MSNETILDNNLIRELAILAANSYKSYDPQNPNCPLINHLEDNNLDLKYIVLCATNNIENDGMEAVLYADSSSYNANTGKYDNIIIAYRGSMPFENFNFSELWDDWIENDFKDIVGAEIPRQFASAAGRSGIA